MSETNTPLEQAKRLRDLASTLRGAINQNQITAHICTSLNLIDALEAGAVRLAPLGRPEVSENDASETSDAGVLDHPAIGGSVDNAPIAASVVAPLGQQEPPSARMTMSQDCKHAQHNKCTSKDCWCVCHKERP